MCLYALNMAKSITNIDKLESRYNTALSMFGEEHPITVAFNAVLNDDVIPYDLFYVPDALLNKAANLNNKYCINLHKEDREFFYIVDHSYWVYAPDTIFLDYYEDLPGVVLVQDYIRDTYENKTTGEPLYDEDALDDYVFNEYKLSTSIDGFSRYTIDELVEHEYGLTDNENGDIDTFKELPIGLQKEFIKKYLLEVRDTSGEDEMEQVIQGLEDDEFAFSVRSLIK